MSQEPGEPTSRPRIAVAIPCYNEAAAIADVLTRWRASLPDAEIVVFDNNSTDGTGGSQGPGVTVAESAMRWQYARSRGPGGQNVNKVNTKAELWVPVAAIVGMYPDALERLVKLAGRRHTLAGEIHIAADSSRSQEGNRIEALARLPAKGPGSRRCTLPSVLR